MGGDCSSDVCSSDLSPSPGGSVFPDVVFSPLVPPPEHSEKEKLETDAMYKLDHGGKDKEKLRAAIPSLSELQDHQAGWKDDFQLNSALRRKFRVCAVNMHRPLPARATLLYHMAGGKADI